ncbi:hypothetical protein D3C72_2452490 [compost metagenome]
MVQIGAGIGVIDMRQRDGDVLEESLGRGWLPYAHENQWQSKCNCDPRQGELWARLTAL